jgi:hypothetical protein
MGSAKHEKATWHSWWAYTLSSFVAVFLTESRLCGTLVQRYPFAYGRNDLLITPVFYDSLTGDI